MKVIVKRNFHEISQSQRCSLESLEDATSVSMTDLVASSESLSLSLSTPETNIPFPHLSSLCTKPFAEEISSPPSNEPNCKPQQQTQHHRYGSKDDHFTDITEYPTVIYEHSHKRRKTIPCANSTGATKIEEPVTTTTSSNTSSPQHFETITITSVSPQNFEPSVVPADLVRSFEKNLSLQEEEEEHYEQLLQLEILEILFEREKEKHSSYANCLGHVTNAYRNTNRKVVGEWLIEVAEDLGITDTTLFYASHYFDRFISLNPQLKKTKYQCIALCSVMIAMKLNEVVSTTFDEMNSYSQNQYTKQEMLTYEQEILNCLQFDLLQVTPVHFVGHFVNIFFGKQPSVREWMFEALKPLLLYSIIYIEIAENYSPSEIALSCIWALTNEQFNNNLIQCLTQAQQYSGFVFMDRINYGNIYSCTNKIKHYQFS